MTYRRTPRGIDEKVAEHDEQLRRIQARLAVTPVITDYGSLTGVPTDLVTFADLAPVAAQAAQGADAAMLAVLMDEA